MNSYGFLQRTVLRVQATTIVCKRERRAVPSARCTVTVPAPSLTGRSRGIAVEYHPVGRAVDGPRPACRAGRAACRVGVGMRGWK